MGETLIDWAEWSWNPITGCDKISPGCKECYAARLAKGRLKRWFPDGFGKVTCHEDRLEQPLHRQKPTVIFVGSMGDLYHKDVPFDFIDWVHAVAAMCPQHVMMMLTKRADRMLEYYRYFIDRDDGDLLWQAWYDYLGVIPEGERTDELLFSSKSSWPLPNVWGGVSVEDEDHLYRVADLVSIPYAKRFISYEPALEYVDFSQYLRYIDLVIMGGESRGRPMHPDWVRRTRDACHLAGTAFYFKQWGQYIESNQTPAETPKYDPKKSLILCSDGSTLPGVGYDGAKLAAMKDHTQVYSVGKKVAGHLLDGKEYREWPK